MCSLSSGPFRHVAPVFFFGLVTLLFTACAPEGDGAPTLALVGGRVIDGTGAPPRPATVLIRGSQIDGVGAELEVPRGTEVIDITGLTVLPGLIDMHGHMYAFGGNQFEAYSALFLAGGVTTAFSPGDFDPEGMTEWRDRIERGEAVGPKILTAGPYFDHDPSIVGWIEGIGSAEEALAKFEVWKDRIDAVKVYTNIAEDELGALAQAAHREGLRMTGHLGGQVSTLRAIELGIDGLEHGIFAIADITDAGQADPLNEQYCSLAALDLDAPIIEELIQAIVEDDVWITPTIVTMQSIHPGFVPPAEEWLDYLAPDLREVMAGIPAYLDEEGEACLDRALSKQLEFVRRVHERGGLVAAGTDPVSPKIVPGYGIHAEMANFVRAGLSPLEAITIATRNGAIALGLTDQIGTVEAGKRADLVVVRGDPSSDISQIGNSVWVFKGGVQHDPAALRESAKGAIGMPTG
jgi:imidazolonepropionase-like amidohydrolase